MRTAFALAVIALLAAPASTAAGAIDCSNATSTVEMNARAEKQYVAADAELNDVDGNAVAYIAKRGGEKPYDAKGWDAVLRTPQRAWIAFRDADCKGLVPMSWGGGTGTSVAMLGCMTHLTQERTKMLKERFAEREGSARVP
jgi:uncharacterized protein YecT (DUF1311 family)